MPHFTCTGDVQVFRAYRESFEEQKVVIEQRFRCLLEESLQDAIYLSAENSQLKMCSNDTRQGSDNII